MPRVYRPLSASALRAAFAAFLLGAAGGSYPALALPADLAHGEQIAKRWCASCHIVSPDQKQAVDSVPAFATIAKKAGFSGDKIVQFLMDPHPKMPDMQLGRDEAKDLGAYIESLAK